MTRAAGRPDSIGAAEPARGRSGTWAPGTRSRPSLGAPPAGKGLYFRSLRRRLAHDGLAHARWPLHTSLLEGINNKIKVIKRMAYGFRDDEYFFLKIRDAFPGFG